MRKRNKNKEILDWKGRPYILGKHLVFSELEDDVEIYMTWEDLKCVTEEEIKNIQQNYPQTSYKHIFHRLYLLERTSSYLKADNSKREVLKERSIQQALKKWKEEMSNKLECLTIVDKKFSTGSLLHPYENELYNTMVEQLTQDSVILVSRDLFLTEWFQNKLDLSKVKEIRVYNRGYLEPTKEEIEILKSVKVYNNYEDMLMRSKDSTLKFVLLGDSTLYRKLYDRITELCITFTDYNRNSDDGMYFSELQLASFDMVDCTSYTDKAVVENKEIEILCQPTYLKRLKGRNLKWKESFYDKKLLGYKKERG